MLIICARMAQETLGFILHDAARLMRRRFDGYARAIGVTRAQWQVLFALSRAEGITQTGLADRLELENITVGRIVDRLEEAGLVERRADPADRRVWRLHLTAKAGPVLDRLRALGDDVLAEAVVGFAPAERERLAELLSRMRANLVAKPADAAARAVER
jgi:MarR family transcriptional regulator, transcriptional regulator for hemolysin